jgi:hypothetical protein
VVKRDLGTLSSRAEGQGEDRTDGSQFPGVAVSQEGAATPSTRLRTDLWLAEMTSLPARQCRVRADDRDGTFRLTRVYRDSPGQNRMGKRDLAEGREIEY